MKKILNYFTGTMMLAVPILIVVCSIINIKLDNNGSNFLDNLPNFDWSDSNYGDGLKVKNINNNNVLSPFLTNNYNSINANISPDNKGQYLDYETFNTGFQWTDSIKKQAVTGSPLNEGFMPNGNYKADFGITSPAQKYMHVNSILDWNPNVDKDAKYNKADIDLQPRVFVASKNSQQDSNIKYNYLGFSSRKHRTFDNTVVGTRNPFENTMLNWQYITNYVNWSGSWFEGPIIPPPADEIDAAHINGTPIFGNIFLDGFHGLTKSMLKDFLRQNSDGTYKIVDLLINIALYNNFDGWFINNESNGVLPNGTILDYNQMCLIMKEFNEKAAKSSDKREQQLKLMYYHNTSSVVQRAGTYIDPEDLKIVTSGAYHNEIQNPINLQLDFGQKPSSIINFLNDFKNYSGKDLFTMLSYSGNEKYLGSYDNRQMSYLEKFINGNRPNYDRDTYTGFSYYMDNGVTEFGSNAYNLDIKHNIDPVHSYLFAEQISNLFNDIQFSGSNLSINEHDKGLQDNDVIKDYAPLNDTKINFVQDAFNADPRIKTSYDKPESSSQINKLIYNYQTNNGENNSSYGIGDIIAPQTTLFDFDNNKDNLNKITNFSTGNGIKFINRDNQGKIVARANSYPWTNKRLTDLLPTYQWEINDVSKKQKINIQNISGFYDYDKIYQKGNSIALGQAINEKGEILPAHWNKNDNYQWNIFGTNLINDNHNLSFIYNDGNNGNNTDVSFLITTVNNNITTNHKMSYDNIVSLADGWKKITLNLTNPDKNNILAINQNNRISKIGLNIVPKNENFKFNVGQFMINTPNISVPNNRLNEITSPNSEYVINREANHQTIYDIRFAWKESNKTNLYYNAIYYYYDNKWYRVGETLQDCYYLKNLKATNNMIELMIMPIYNNENKIVENNNHYIFTINV